MDGLAKIVLTTVAVISVACAAAIVFFPPASSEHVHSPGIEGQRLVDQLTHAIWDYHHDHGEFPSGDGIGSASLARALRKPSRSGYPYMVFVPEMLTAAGDIRNPESPALRILHYRNNRTSRSPVVRVHNERSFDLWGHGADGRESGVNNWD